VTLDSGSFTQAMAGQASAVGVVCVRDEDDDLGITTTSFASASLDPPLVVVLISRASYLAEVLDRQPRWSLTVLAEHQRHVASRFAASGRPSARLLLADIARHRGPLSDALIIEGGIAGLECETEQQVPAGDHTLLLARVQALDYLDPKAPPLVYFRRRYRGLGAS
jgi:flavin reductase (DIM6/NTAB) family NADH-FMN oxidoreductase RutF